MGRNKVYELEDGVALLLILRDVHNKEVILDHSFHGRMRTK